MKKNYKEFEKVYLGYSDIAGIVARSYDRVEIVRFGSDGSYKAYLCENAEIGDHYKKVFEANDWVWFYDDHEKRLEVVGKTIEIWRSGEFGIIINVIGE